MDDLEVSFEKPRTFRLRVPLFLGVRFGTRKPEPPKITLQDWRDLHVEINHRIAVADAVEKSLASTVWKHREFVDSSGRPFSFYVTNVTIRDLDIPGEFWLYVELSEQHDAQPPVHVPLHEFLKECEPLRALTFVDHQA